MVGTLSMPLKVGSGFFAIVLAAAIVLPLLSAHSAEAAAVPSTVMTATREAPHALNISCVRRNVGYAIDYIINHSPWWYRAAIRAAWSSFLRAPNPHNAAVLIGLLGPWGPAVLSGCR